MDYNQLDINQRINLKVTYQSFLKIAIERFKGSLDKKLYRYRSRGARKLTRTRNLYNSMEDYMIMGTSGIDMLQIKFLLYGRFLDMGVGKGTNVNAAMLRKRYTVHRSEEPRKPIRWYSKTKEAEQHKLAEILASQYGIGMVKLAENLLNNTVTIPM